jgi:hypothetical protein
MGTLELRTFETSRAECVTRAKKSLESGSPVMIGYFKDGRVRIGRGVVRDVMLIDRCTWRITMSSLHRPFISDETL